MKITIYCNLPGLPSPPRSEALDTETFGLTDAEWNALTEDEKQKRVLEAVFDKGLIEVWHEEAQ